MTAATQGQVSMKRWVIFDAAINTLVRVTGSFIAVLILMECSTVTTGPRLQGFGRDSGHYEHDSAEK